MDDVVGAVRPEDSLYETDFFTWTCRQAELMRAGRLGEADLPNLIEELESLGRGEYSALRSSYRLIASHLLKMQFQPSRSSRSWRSTIIRERTNVEDSLKDNPGLRPKRAEIVAAAYAGARREAADETGLPLKSLPAQCPFTLEQLEDHGFFIDPP